MQSSDATTFLAHHEDLIDVALNCRAQLFVRFMRFRVPAPPIDGYGNVVPPLPRRCPRDFPQLLFLGERTIDEVMSCYRWLGYSVQYNAHHELITYVVSVAKKNRFCVSRVDKKGARNGSDRT